MIPKSNCFLETRLYKNESPFPLRVWDPSRLSPSSALLFSQGLWWAWAAVLSWSSAALPSPQLLSGFPGHSALFRITNTYFFSPPYTKIITYLCFLTPNPLQVPSENSFFLGNFFFLPTGSSSWALLCSPAAACAWLPRRAPRFPGCSYNNRKLNTHSGDC